MVPSSLGVVVTGLVVDIAVVAEDSEVLPTSPLLPSPPISSSGPSSERDVHPAMPANNSGDRPNPARIFNFNPSKR